MHKENIQNQKEQSQPSGVQNVNSSTPNNIQQNTNEPQVNKNSQPLTSLRSGYEMNDVQNNNQITNDTSMNDNCMPESNNPNPNDIIDPNSIANQSNSNNTQTATPVPVSEPKTWSINPINSIMTFEYSEDAKAQSLKEHLETVEKGFDSIKDLFAEM